MKTNNFKDYIETCLRSSNWELTELITEEKILSDEVKIFLCGIEAKNKDGQYSIGSAIDFSSSPTDRALFELLERIAIFEALGEREDKLFNLYGDGILQSIQLSKGEIKQFDSNLFAQNVEHRHAFSNGVAFARNLLIASKSSRLEMLERDIVLRHWYSRTPPNILPIDESTFLNPFLALNEFFDYQVASFDNIKNIGETPHVICFFAWPKKAGIPVHYGFGCSDIMQVAVEKAQRECLQRMAFLWDERFSEDLEFSPSPLYHQEYYCNGNGMKKLKNWLEGNEIKQMYFRQLDIKATSYIDITPEWFKEDWKVVKAVNDSCIPLIFGKGYGIHGVSIPNDLTVHPIC